MQVLKITTDDVPNYPLIIEQGKDYVFALESILAEHPIFGGVVLLNVGSSVNINIEVVEMSQEEFDALEPWEP